MIVMLCLRWWYGAGWRWAFERGVLVRMQRSLTAFSVKSLAKTWLSPFKQTVSDARKGSIDLKVQAAVDNLVSRVIGTLARTILIMCGLGLAGFSAVTGFVFLLIWPLLPLMPVIAVVLAIGGSV